MLNTSHRLQFILSLFPIAFALTILAHLPFVNPEISGLSIFHNHLIWLSVFCFFLSGLFVCIKNKIHVLTLEKKSFFFAGLLLLSIPLGWHLSQLSYDYSAIRLIVLLIGSVFVFTLFTSLKQYKRYGIIFLCLCIIIGGLLEIFYGFIQIEAAKTMPIFGWMNNGKHPSGNFYQRNVYASFLTSLFAVCIFFSCYGHRWFKAKRQQIYLLIFLSAIAMAIGYLLCFVESLMGYVTFGLVAFVAIIAKKYRKHNLIFISSGLVGVILALSVKAFMFDYQHSNKSSSSSSRIQLIEDSLLLIAEKPLLGHGYGKNESVFAYQTMKFNENELTDRWYFQKERVTHPHNEVMYWGVEAGLVSLIGLFLIVCFFYFHWRTISIHTRWLHLGLITPILFHCLVEFPLYFSALHILILCIFLTFILLNSRLAIQKSTGHHRIVFFTTLGVSGICGLLFTITAFQSFLIFAEFKQKKTIETDVLANMWNPMPYQTQIDYAKNYELFLYGAMLNDQEKLQKFVAQTEVFLIDHPWLGVYQNYIAALIQIGEKEKAKKALNMAKTIFYKEDWSELTSQLQ